MSFLSSHTCVLMWLTHLYIKPQTAQDIITPAVHAPVVAAIHISFQTSHFGSSHFARTFLCLCGKGFVCVFRGPAPSVQRHMGVGVVRRHPRGRVAHHSAWPTSITPVASSQRKSNQPRHNESARQRGPAQEQPGQPHRQDSPQSARNANAVPNLTPEAIAEAAAVEVRRLEEAVGALGEESPHALRWLRQLEPNSTSPSVSRSSQRHSIWNEPGRGWFRPRS